MACDGRFTAGHGQMRRLHLDAVVAEAATPSGRLIARLVTIPGI